MAEHDENVKAFLEELDREIGWEWRWEKRHRRWGWGVNWATWVARVLILGASTYQLSSRQKGVDEVLVTGCVALLSVLNIGLPLLAFTFRFQQRQEVHDRNARAYAVIRVELVSGLITLREAADRFKEIRSQPTEKTIRSTP